MTRPGPAGTPRHAAVAGDARRAGPRHRRPSSSGSPAATAPGWRGRRRGALILAGAAALGLVAGPSFAYFTAVGSGAGAAGTTTLQPLLVSSAVPSSGLLPGTTADLTLTVSNPNSAAVTVTGVSQAGGVSVTGGSGCTGDTAGVSALAQTGLSIAVAGGATVTIHLAAASMTTASAAGCQGASFQIPVAVAVRQ